MKKLNILLIAILLVWVTYLSFEISLIQNNTVEVIEETTIIENTINGFSSDLTEVIEDNAPYVVGVTSKHHDGMLQSASGVIWDVIEGEVYILTSFYLYNENETIEVIFDNGDRFSSEIVGVDEVTSIMLLKVMPGFSVEAIHKSDSSLLKNGEWVIATGSSQVNANQGNLAIGLLSKVNSLTILELENQNIESWQTLTMKSQIEVGSGLLGGPLINMAGEMVGLNSTLSDELSNSSTLIPVNELKKITKQLIELGSVTRLDFGTTVLDVANLANYQKSSLGINLDITSGLYIEQIEENSIASELGIKEGDILIMIDETNLTNFDAYRDFLYDQLLFEKVTVIRNNENIDLLGSVDD